MSGELPAAYRGRPVLDEVIDGIDHHWVWSLGGIHRSRVRRVGNYLSFAAAAGLRALTLPTPTVVLVSSPPLTVAPLGPLLGRRFRRPWLLEVRDIWPESAVSVGWLRRESAAYSTLERVAHRVTAAADAVIVPTPGLEPLVRSHGARRTVVLPGASVPRTPDRRRREAARARHGIASDECLFLYLGAIGVANAVDLLLEAVRQVPAEVRCRVVIAGDGSARGTIEAALGDPDLRRVALLPPVPIDEVDELLAAADVGLHLLRADAVFASALPTKVLDYLGAHLPFITSVPGLPSRIAAESGGSSAATASELAAELERWTAIGEAERRRLGEEAFAYGQQRYGLDAGVSRLEDLLASVGSRP